MNDKTFQAFIEELTAMEKEAGVGSAAVSALGAAGKWMTKQPQLATYWAKNAPGRLAGWAKAKPGAVVGWAKKQPGDFVEAGKRMLRPHKSIPAGWRHMTPSKELAHMRASGASPEAIKKYTKGMGSHITEQGILPKKFVDSPHRVGRAAEWLSRRGWTGKGDVTKYIPGFSQKGMYTGFGAMSGKSIYDAAQKNPTRTGSGGAAETGLGEALGTGAFIAGTGGLGMIPATAMWLGGQYLGSRAGRVVDRMRGGADLRTATLAPTPEEANKMIGNLENQSPEEQQKTIDMLQRYYG